MSEARSKRSPHAAYAVAAVGILHGVFSAAQWLKFLARGAGPEDSIVWWTAGRILRSGQGTRLYDLALQSSVQGRGAAVAYVLPPHLSVLLYPLGFLEPQGVYSVVSVMQCVVLAIVVGVLLQTVAHSWSRVERFLAVAATVSATPVVHAIQLGSLSMLVSATGIGALIAARKQRNRLSGACLALTAFKPQLALIVVIVLLLTRQFRPLRTAAVGTAFLGIVSLPLIGLGAYPGFVRLLGTYASPFNKVGSVPLGMWNLRALALRVYPSVAQNIAMCAYGLAILAIVLTTLHRNRKQRGASGSWAFAMIISLAFLAPYVSSYDNSFVLFAGWLLHDDLRGRASWHRLVPAGFATVIVLISFPGLENSARSAVLLPTIVMLLFSVIAWVVAMDPQRATGPGQASSSALAGAESGEIAIGMSR